MNARKDNKNFDELIAKAIGRDSPEFDFDTWKQTFKKEIDIFELQSTGCEALRSAEPPILWRMIMNSRITKPAAVAVVILAVVLGVTLSEKSITPVYAIEQTIQAMRSVHSVCAYCTDWDGSKGEVWIKIDPETGQEEYYYSDIGNLMIVATPQKTFYYHKDKNLVRIRNEHVLAAEVRVSKLFEDLPDLIERLNGKLDFKSVFDQDLNKQVIRVHGYIPAQKNFGEKEFIINVDPKTKLPINTETLKAAPGQGVKSSDHFEYNVEIPQGLFDFEIPEGAKVVYE